MGSAGPVAGADLVGVWCRSCKVVPSLSIFLEGGSTGVLGGGNCPFDGVAMVDVTGTEGLLETVLIAFLWCSSVTVAGGKFTVHVYAW